MVKIAIPKNDIGFHKRWVAYCKERNIPYKLVDVYGYDIVDQLVGCDAFMWHFQQTNYKDMLFARQLLYAVQNSGKAVFPDFETVWHFDDKVGQKYLLESIGAPLVPSYVFYTKKEALEWIEYTSFPKVFKLRGGAGSVNVKLAHTKQEAVKLVKKAFGNGFKQYDPWTNLKERWRKYRIGKTDIVSVIKGMARFIIPTEFSRMYHPEKGYVYFQDYIPGNDSDIRVVVVGDKAFAIKRMVRKGDFRASGSGVILYDKVEIDERCVYIAFQLNKKLKSQSIAYDFVFDSKNAPLLVEISYGFVAEGYDACPGYWTEDLEWHEGLFNPEGWMIDDLLEKRMLC